MARMVRTVRALAAIAALFFLLPAYGQGEDSLGGLSGLSKADQTAIRKVIKAQLSALQHDNAQLAFSYASPMIQRQFGTPQNFLDMVRTTYPSVYRPRDMQFRELEATEDGPMQKVFFFGPDSMPVLGLFYMRQQSDGRWKINGCELTDAPDTSI